MMSANSGFVQRLSRVARDSNSKMIAALLKRESVQAFFAQVGPLDAVIEPSIEAKNQFALELDHMAECVTANKKPHTPGEEGLQDQRIVEAIYESARTGRKISLTPSAATRGSELTRENAT